MNPITVNITKTGTQEQYDTVATALGWTPTVNTASPEEAPVIAPNPQTSVEFCAAYYNTLLDESISTELKQGLLAQQAAAIRDFDAATQAALTTATTITTV